MNLFHVAQSLIHPWQRLYPINLGNTIEVPKQNLKHDLKKSLKFIKCWAGNVHNWEMAQTTVDPPSVYKVFLNTNIHDSSY